MCRAGWTQSSSRRRAFTLVELMVVLVVMAIIAGAVAPAIVSAARRMGLKRATTQVMDLLDFACAAAIARRQPVTVNFNLDRNTCWASVWPMSLPWLEEAESVETLTLAALQLPEGISVSFYRESETGGMASQESWERIRFEPDGTAQDVLIELTDQSERVRTIEVIAATGELLLTEER